MNKRNSFRAIILLLAISFLTFGAATTYAEDILWSGSMGIQFEIEAFDACPNIPGAQPTIPAGMLQDTNGNCYTPAPPDPPNPPIIDLCNNISGVQAVIPSGYYRRNGNCYPQPAEPAPPVDVCPNLSDAQAEVPEDYFLDPETNECLPVVSEEPPDKDDKDVCRNIPGIQISTPSGMRNDNGYCYTPAPTPPSPPSTQKPPELANVPDFLQPIGQFFVGLVPEPVKEFFRGLPADVTDRLPLYVFILVLILILIPIPQSIREYIYKRRLAAFFKREQNIAEEKDNFVTLASHYLRTPITIMQNSISLMQTTGGIPPASAEAMSRALNTLSGEVSASIETASMNAATQPAINPSAVKTKPFWRSGFFWLPIIVSIILTIIVNFLIGVVGEREIGTNNALLQAVIVIAFIIILYLLVRNYQIQKKLRQEEDALIAQEQTIDATRNGFIEQQTATIGAALSDLQLATPTDQSSKAFELYSDGLSRLKSVYGKFAVLPYIKAASNRNATPFNVRAIVDNAIAYAQPSIDAKQLSVQNAVHNIAVNQNESLFMFVISSIIDNAIKFTDPGGQIVISSNPQTHIIEVHISDNGRGIDPAKIDQLFKPFSRAESAVDFNYEGLGLSLFLDRLILNYTGGTIAATPRTGGGTDITITTPIDITIQNEPITNKKPRK